MDASSMMMKMTYRPQQKKPHILCANDAAALFEYLDIRIREEGCNHTHRFCQAWLEAHVDFMKHSAILNEMEDMGGYCDCEVLRSCYEDYEL